MEHATTRLRLLELSAKALPFALGTAFVFSYYTNIGTGVILALSAWYLALNWRAVLGSRWALCVVGFFTAIAFKDGVMFALGEGSFRAFAKSGSRVFVLLGSAALVLAYERERLERALEAALGITFAAIGAAFLAMRAGLLPWIFNSNTFGMLGVWFPLVLAARLRRGGGRRGYLAAAGVLAAGLAVFLADAVAATAGSRTAPPALLLGAFAILLPKRPKRLGPIAGAAVFCLALVSVTVLSIIYIPRVDKLLASRQQLWQAFSQKALEKPVLGWGFTEEDDNRRLIGPILEGKNFHQEFMEHGYGSHNSFLGMFFENGAAAALLFAALFLARVLRSGTPFGPFDASVMAYLGFMSADSMNPGGLTFLGFYLGLCLLAERSTRVAPKAPGAAA